MRVAVIHGPNLGLLGRREPEVYGTSTLADVDGALEELGRELGIQVECFQSNHEGGILDYLEEIRVRVQGLVVNAGALTHTSIALRDGLVASELPFVEVHLSNTAARERFRRHSYLAPVASGVVFGFGVESYLLGLRGLVAKLRGADRG
jgi:3-dehydroquinate dehydratase-2